MDKNLPPQPNLVAGAYRLGGLGVREPWQTALLLPTAYNDPLERLSDHRLASPDRTYCVRIEVVGAARTFYGPTRLVVVLMDAAGQTFRATVFGEADAWRARLVEGASLQLRIRFKWFQDRLQGTISDEVDPVWAERLQPTYPGVPTVITADEVREIVLGLLPRALPRAVREIEARLARLGAISELLGELEAAGWTLRQVLQQAHVPRNREYAEFAREVLLKLAALDALASTETHTVEVAVAPLALTSRDRRARQLPFDLSEHQSRAIEELAVPLIAGRLLKGALIGDVGSGKTAVYAVLAASTVDSGGRAAILLPNTVLAEQVHREISDFFPDLTPVLVTGDAAGGDLLGTRLIIGTTAILHRRLPRFDLVVVDEEQKFSVEQKGQLLAPHTHQLVVSATCIPRTQALARYNVATVAVLPAGHTNRFIETRLIEPAAKAQLFAEVRADVRQGVQVLVVYPLRGEADIDPGEARGADSERRESDLRSVRGAFEAWAKVFGAERVRMLTGDAPEDTKRVVMGDMREGRADILLATTVVEVGVTFPRLRRVIVMEPDRFGLSTLHQLRGRAARAGGEGNFDLLLKGEISEKTRARLDVLTQFANGFDVALRDLEQRGYGDLADNGRRQTGAGERILFGQACPLTITDAVYPIYARRAAARRTLRASPALLAGPAPIAETRGVRA